MNGVTPPLKVTDYLAIYGALLSTGVFVWTLWRARKRIAVSLVPSFGKATDGSDGNGYVIMIRNLSTVPVQISNVGLSWPTRKPTMRGRLRYLIRYRRIRWINWTHASLPPTSVARTPVVVESGQSHLVWIDREGLAYLRERAIGDPVAATVSDGVYRRYRSRPTELFLGDDLID